MDIIRHDVWLYSRFNLSYRDLEELFAERRRRSSYSQMLCTPSSGGVFDNLNSVLKSYSFDHLGQALRPV